jgi:hypothetical protein
MSAQSRKLLLVRNEGEASYRLMIEVAGKTHTAQLPPEVGEDLMARLCDLVIETAVQRGIGRFVDHA